MNTLRNPWLAAACGAIVACGATIALTDSAAAGQAPGPSSQLRSGSQIGGGGDGFNGGGGGFGAPPMRPPMQPPNSAMLADHGMLFVLLGGHVFKLSESDLAVQADIELLRGPMPPGLRPGGNPQGFGGFGGGAPSNAGSR